MQLRYKVVLLAVVPLVLAAGTLAFVVERKGTALADRQVAVVEQVLLTAKQDELRDLVALARKAVRELEHADPDDRNDRQVLDRVRDLSFGEDGYFYIYDLDSDATTLMHARSPGMEGHDQSELRDDTGQLIMPPLYAMARAGGGFVHYRWQRPSQGRWTPKLGYVVPLPRHWMLGTGIYLDDVEATTRHIRASSSAAIRDTMIFIAVIAVLAVLAVAAVGIALNVSQQRLADSKLRRLTWQVVTAQETERARMSRFLHDEAVQDLIAVKCVLETTLLELVSLSHGKLAETLQQGLASLAEGVDGIRRLSRDLRPPLQGDGLPAALEQIGAAFSDRSGLNVTVDAPLPERSLSAEAATALLRVTQQALDNVERHARARRVTIQLATCSRRGASGISLLVSDDGRGFDVAAVEGRPGGGIGLLNMRERIEALGGQLAIRSGPGGTEVKACLPDGAIAEGDHHDDDKA